MLVNRLLFQNKTNSENGHLGFSIFKKNKKTTESVIFRLYFKDNVKPIDYITNKLCYISTNVQSWQDVDSQSSEGAMKECVGP